MDIFKAYRNNSYLKNLENYARIKKIGLWKIERTMLNHGYIEDQNKLYSYLFIIIIFIPITSYSNDEIFFGVGVGSDGISAARFIKNMIRKV